MGSPSDSELPNDLEMTASAPAKPASDPGLPPVEPPSAGFLIQLFLIPMIIVSIIVLGWFVISWIANQGVDAHDLARSLRTKNDASWQKAYTLSNILRDARKDELKKDAELAAELIAVLQGELSVAIEKPLPSSMKTRPDQANISKREYRTMARVRLRMFLCYALGQFEIEDVADVLARAATQEDSPQDLEVRRSAVQSLAILASNVDLTEDQAVTDALLLGSKERSSNPEDRLPRDLLRSDSAFALGTLGNEAALERLGSLLRDNYANVRYNAATALARHGDDRCIDTLVEMLDPASEAAVEEETREDGRRFKRAEVLNNAIRSIRKFSQANPDTDLAPIRDALTKLAEAGLSRDVTYEAKAMIAMIKERN